MKKQRDAFQITTGQNSSDKSQSDILALLNEIEIFAELEYLYGSRKMLKIFDRPKFKNNNHAKLKTKNIELK